MPSLDFRVLLRPIHGAANAYQSMREEAIWTALELKFSRIGAVPIIILTYLGFSLLVSGFVLTVLAYAPTDSYMMVMIQDMGIAGFVGPVSLVIGLIIFVVGLVFCLCGKRDDEDE